MKLALDFSPQKFVWTLYLIAVALLLASLAVSFWALYGNADNYWFFTHNFDFDEKNNVPHVFKSVLLVLCAGAIFLNARAAAQSGGNFATRWRVLGWIFLALALDEDVQIHQKTISLFVAWVRGVDVDTAKSAKMFWILPYLVLTAILSLAYFNFWWKLPSRTRAWFAVAGIVYIGGAAVVEEVAHKYAEHFGDTNVPYLFLTNFSEFMQMIGSIIFIQTLLSLYSERTRNAV